MKTYVKKAAAGLIAVLTLASCTPASQPSVTGTATADPSKSATNVPFTATYDYTMYSSNDQFRFYEIKATYEGAEHAFLCRVPCKDVPDYAQDASVASRMDPQINTLNAMSKVANVWVYVASGLENHDVMLDIAPAEYKGSNFNYFKDHLSDGVWFGCLDIKTIKDRVDGYYASDHHWNSVGMDKAYREIAAAMAEKYPDITAREGVFHETAAQYIGSIGRGTSVRSYMDTFAFFDYNLPDHETKVLRVDNDNKPTRKAKNGVVLYASEVSAAENMAKYLSGEWNKNIDYDHYVNFYPICDEIVYSGNSTGRNLLFIGDSFSLGLQELVASHFDKTYFFYSDGTATLYKKRDFAAYCENNGITDVIVIEDSTRLFYDYYDYSGPALCNLVAE